MFVIFADCLHCTLVHFLGFVQQVFFIRFLTYFWSPAIPLIEKKYATFHSGRHLSKIQDSCADSRSGFMFGLRSLIWREIDLKLWHTSPL